MRISDSGKRTSTGSVFVPSSSFPRKREPRATVPAPALGPACAGTTIGNDPGVLEHALAAGAAVRLGDEFGEDGAVGTAFAAQAFDHAGAVLGRAVLAHLPF